MRIVAFVGPTPTATPELLRAAVRIHHVTLVPFPAELATLLREHRRKLVEEQHPGFRWPEVEAMLARRTSVAHAALSVAA